MPSAQRSRVPGGSPVKLRDAAARSSNQSTTHWLASNDTSWPFVTSRSRPPALAMPRILLKLQRSAARGSSAVSQSMAHSRSRRIGRSHRIRYESSARVFRDFGRSRASPAWSTAAPPSSLTSRSNS